MGVSATCGQCRNVPMCLRNLQKIGAWGPNRNWDIDLPTLPCICSTWPGFCVPVLCPWLCQHLPSALKMSLMCCRNLQKILVYGILIEAEILTFPTPPYICSTWPSFWALALHPWMYQHLLSGLEMFLCVSETSKKFGAWGPNRSWDIDLPLPHVFAQIGLVFGHWHSAHRCVNTSQVVCSYVS